MTAIPAERVIKSLEDLLQVIGDLRDLTRTSKRAPKRTKLTKREEEFVTEVRKSPYRRRGRSLELWFRGESDAAQLLSPGSFRKKELGRKGGKRFYEETSATFHFNPRRNWT